MTSIFWLWLQSCWISMIANIAAMKYQA